MANQRTQPAFAAAGAHLVLYDGECGLCSGLVEFLLIHDRRGAFVFASLQSATGRAVVQRLGDDLARPTTLYVLANDRTPHGRAMRRSCAVLFIARQLGWPWKAAIIVRVLPRPVLDRAYNFMARHRYRVLGRREQCLPPRPEFRGRFVE